MPNHKSAIERVRRNEKQNNRNRAFKKNMRESVKTVVQAKDKKQAQENLSKSAQLIDKMVVKGILNKNRAAKTKSRLAKKVNALA